MKSLRSFALATTGLAISMVVTIAVNIYGWGLTPRNWLVIVPFHLVGLCIGLTFVELAKGEE